jgi:hypothetical protein
MGRFSSSNDSEGELAREGELAKEKNTRASASQPGLLWLITGADLAKFFTPVGS